MYVRLGYEFNIACRAFTSIGVETSDLGPVPEALRSILEDTLSQEACPASLDRYLPRIRDIIINLLHGLKRKQSRLRARQTREDSQASSSRAGSGQSGLTQILDSVPPHRPTSRNIERRVGSGGSTFAEDFGVLPRTSSVQNGASSPAREKNGISLSEQTSRDLGQDPEPNLPSSPTDSSLSSNTMQSMPILFPDYQKPPMERMPHQPNPTSAVRPPPPPPPKEQDALAALQRGGDLERRASRRYSAYQISKVLGASPSGVPMLPSSQNSPIPNRGRDVRESLNAVRVRGNQGTRQRSTNRFGEPSPTRGNPVPRRISEASQESGQSNENANSKPHIESTEDDIPTIKTPGDKYGPSFADLNNVTRPEFGGIANGTSINGASKLANHGTNEVESSEPQTERTPILQHRDDTVSLSHGPQPNMSSEHVEQFVPEQSPQPGKELTLFLQYKSKIKKYVLQDGLSDLSMARLQLAFIEKFAWNTHSNGIDLPEIYIQDSVSGVRHELEDLSDVKDRSVLVLNVEVLDEVKRHFDEGLGGLRRAVDGVRTALEGQQTTIKQVSTLQQDAAKSIARLPTGPLQLSTRAPSLNSLKTNEIRSSSPSVDASNQISSIQSLRRDLAVVRQAFTSFTTEVSTSMSEIRAKAVAVQSNAVEMTVPALDVTGGRAYVNTGKKTVGEESEAIVNRVDDLQDLVEDLRKDVVTRGVRPLPRQLETVSKDISLATAGLKKMQEYVKREKPVWTKIWEKELELVCNDREFLTMQEELVADLEDDLEKATQTFALVEQATKQQNLHASQTSTGTVNLRNTSRSLNSMSNDLDVDPMKAKDGVLGEVRALQPNHETRLEAIARAEKARQRELENRREGEFKKELGSFVDEGKLKKSGGVEEAERLRKAKDEKNRREGWEVQQARAAGKAKESEDKTRKDNSEPSNGSDEGTMSPELQHFSEAHEEQGDELPATSTDAGER